MENLTFRGWAFAQAESFATAMAKASGRGFGIHEDFKDAVIGILDDFECFDCHDMVDTLVYGNFVITINKGARKLGLLNTRNGKYVETYCNKKDMFDSSVGLGILWAKYNHIERPKFRTKKKLSELKPHEVFTLSGGTYYEFIGTIESMGLKNKYVVYSLDTGNTYRFEEDTAIVEE